MNNFNLLDNFPPLYLQYIEWQTQVLNMEDIFIQGCRLPNTSKMFFNLFSLNIWLKCGVFSEKFLPLWACCRCCEWDVLSQQDSSNSRVWLHRQTSYLRSGGISIRDKTCDKKLFISCFFYWVVEGKMIELQPPDIVEIFR